MNREIYTKESGEYLKNNPLWHSEDSQWKAQQILKMIERHGLKPTNILEIGCGVGEILNHLHHSLPEHCLLKGVEISPDALSLAKTKEKERLNFQHTDEFETGNTIDLSLMIDVFEHVDDYLGFLQKWRMESKYSIFHIPLDLSSQAILRGKLEERRKNYGHLHYFTKATALLTLEDAGYQIIDHFYTNSSNEGSIHSKKQALAILPRKLLAAISQDLAANLLGGFSLLVLTRNQ